MNSDIPSSSKDSTENIDIEQTTWAADILRNRRRIQVLLELASAGEEGVSVSELADRLAERDHGAGFGSEQRRRIFIALYQSHLPKLEADSVIDRKKNRDYVARGRRFNEVVSTLAQLQK
ncbi:DUF7344 domain-containing protein [Halorubrum lipolyticum]